MLPIEYSKNKYVAYIPLSYYFPEVSNTLLIEAIQELDKLGYEYYNTAHDIGYYDEVENIRLEFHKRK